MIPTAGLSAYAPSKAAVASLTLTLAEELAAERIWVNAVLPSIMDTPANRAAMRFTAVASDPNSSVRVSGTRASNRPSAISPVARVI